jgi:hypothetical protein
MKNFIEMIFSFIFNLICSVFNCSYKRLDDAYQTELPASPEAVRQTLLYKRLRRFVKLAIAFRRFELILEYYEYMPTSVSRCVWNILRDETKYVLFNKEKYYSNTEIYNEIVLGKWSRDNRFIKVASIKKEVINDEEGDERTKKFLLLISANYNNFVLGEASSLEEAHKLLAELPEHIVVSESNGFDTDDYYVFKRNVVIVESK